MSAIINSAWTTSDIWRLLSTIRNGSSMCRCHVRAGSLCGLHNGEERLNSPGEMSQRKRQTVVKRMSSSTPTGILTEPFCREGICGPFGEIGWGTVPAVVAKTCQCQAYVRKHSWAWPTISPKGLHHTHTHTHTHTCWQTTRVWSQKDSRFQSICLFLRTPHSVTLSG